MTLSLLWLPPKKRQRQTQLSFGVRWQVVILLGFRSRRESVTELLAEHESSYLGSYEVIQVPTGLIRVRDNRDPMYQEGDPSHEQFAYPTYSAFSVIVEVDEIETARQIAKRVNGRFDCQLLGDCPDAT